MKSGPATMPVASPQAQASAPPRVRRSRHHPRSLSIIYGSCLLLLAFVCFMGFVWFTGTLLISGDRSSGIVALSLFAGFGLSRLLAFLNNRQLSCTLCHGTILHEKRCRKHADATRIPGLSYRAATATSVVCTGSFRCMYCGTPYRLKK